MNDIIAASKKHFSAYSKMKRENTEIFMWHLKKFSPITGKAVIVITWNFKNKRRDPDNIMASQKFIMDALVKNGVLKDDTVDYIDSIRHHFNLCDEDSVTIKVEAFQPELQ